jgi:hypothetical protein
VPRRAGKVGSKTIDLLTSNLLKPEELLERIDATDAVEALRAPLVQAVDEISRDLAEEIRPGLWDSLPEAARKAIQARIQAQAPRVTENMLNEMKADLSRYVDLQFLAVTTLVRNKDKLVKLMRGVSNDAMAFVRRSGIYFGLGIGLVQRLHRTQHAVPPGAAEEVSRLHRIPGAAARPTGQDHPRLRQDPGRRSLLTGDPFRRHH